MTKNSESPNLVIILTGGDGFPAGGAYTNRIIAFAKGLVNNNCKVTVLIIYPGKNNHSDTQGTINGFDYFFCTGLKRPKNVLLKKIIGIKGIYESIRILCKLNKQHPVDAILTFSQAFSQNFPLYLFTRFSKASLIRETSEFPPIVLKRGHDKLKPCEKVFSKFVNRFYDGYIYISSALSAFHKKLLSRNMPVEIVPIIVDKERFRFPEIQREKWITYCGNLFGEKDGVKTLLKAFSAIHHKHPVYKLMLIGNTSNPKEFAELKKLVNKLGIDPKAEFTGLIPSGDVPTYLVRSSVLVLARPDNIQAKGGFPTKLGEYLASGRPVLVTATSDIPVYIKDGVNGYLAKPDSVDDFAEKLDWILSNYKSAEKAGIEGKKLTEKEFSNVYQSKRVIDFIKRVKQLKN